MLIKLFFNVLDTFNTNPLDFPEEISKSIKILLNKVYKPEKLTELYIFLFYERFKIMINQNYLMNLNNN